MDGWAWLSADEADTAIIMAIAEETIRMRELMDDNLAKKIANAVWSSIK